MTDVEITVASFRKNELRLAGLVQDRFTRNTGIHTSLKLYAVNGWYALTIRVIFVNNSTKVGRARYVMKARRIARRIRREVQNETTR